MGRRLGAGLVVGERLGGENQRSELLVGETGAVCGGALHPSELASRFCSMTRFQQVTGSWPKRSSARMSSDGQRQRISVW